ncbi:TRAP transporter large permease [candidate division KSB1 bacterium]
MDPAISVFILCFILLLVINVPIAFCIGISTLLLMIFTIPLDYSFTTVAQRMATSLDSFSLLAIPFFILSGLIMGRGGIAKRLIDLAKAAVGMLPGGLVYVNILACMFFGSLSGSAVAATAAIGGFMIPLMNKEGYDKNYSVAVTVTSSTTGLLIPPSNILIVYSLVSGGVSIAALFIAGYVPGILVGLGIMFVCAIIAKSHNHPVGTRAGFKVLIKKVFESIPSLFLIVIVIGGIISGIFTATEASVVAVLYSILLSVVIYRELKLNDLPEILLKTVETTAIVLILIGTSSAMSWILSYENIPQNISSTLLSLTDNKIFILLIINVILLIVGIFMDITPAVLIFTPIFLPVVTNLGISPLHFGIIMVLNLCIGLCTPPVGNVLFVGCGIGNTNVIKVIKPMLPMYFAMIVILFLITYFPALTMFLPKLFGY